MSLDPHVRRLLGALAAAQAPGAPVPDLARRRVAFRDLMRLSDVGAAVAGIEDRAVPGPGGTLALRLYTPAQAAPGRLPGLVFLHGGGLVCGDLGTHDALCRALCQESGCRVVAVDYRLAPEHPFPAAVEDAEAACGWVIDHAAALGLDPARIAIGGDSAGATLAAAACQHIAATRPGALALQLLLCPILDRAGATSSRRAFGQGYLLDAAVMAQELAEYLPPGGDAAHPRVSPLLADLRGQPPACIHTAAFDPLRDEGRAYVEKLRLAGVAVRHTCHPGMVHLFYGFSRVVPYARTALAQIGAELRAMLAWEGSSAAA